MRLVAIAIGALALTSVASPAFALSCFAPEPSANGIDTEYSFSLSTDNGTNGGVVEDNMTEEQASNDLQRLKRIGVDAEDTERWSGCIKAYVRTSSGLEQQFYHPDSLRRVD